MNCRFNGKVYDRTGSDSNRSSMGYLLNTISAGDNTFRQKPARFSGRTSGNHSDTTSKTISNLEKRKS